MSTLLKQVSVWIQTAQVVQPVQHHDRGGPVTAVCGSSVVAVGDAQLKLESKLEHPKVRAQKWGIFFPGYPNNSHRIRGT